jgi:hypothetical protein
LLALDTVRTPPEAARAAYRAAEAAASVASEALGRAVRAGVLNEDERRFMAARVQLSQYALEAKETVFAPNRASAGNEVRLEAQKLKQSISDLVSVLSGDLTEENDDESPGGGALPGGRILVHDHNTSTIRFSLIKRLKVAQVLPVPPEWLLPCLEELLVTSLFRLKCTYWSGPVLPGAVIKRAASSIFDMKRERLEKDYYQTKINLTASQLQAANLLPKDEFRTRELSRIEGEMNAQQQSFVAAASIERPRLESLLAVLPAIKQATDSRQADGMVDLTDLTAGQVPGIGRDVLQSIADGGSSWHHEFCRPPRIHQQNDLVRNRGVATSSWIEWLRSVQFAARTGSGQAQANARISDLLGSAYSGEIPGLVNGTSVSVDHTCPQSWFIRSSQLYLNGTPPEDLIQCVLCTRGENSSKSNKPVFLGQTDADLVDSADKTFFRLPARDANYFSDARKAVICRALAYSFCCYMLVGQSGNDGWMSFDASTGCKYYATLVDEENQDPNQRDDTLLRLTEAPVQEMELINSLVLFYVTGWMNPFISNTQLIRDTRFRELLKKRLRGETRVPGALAGALSGLIVGFS